MATQTTPTANDPSSEHLRPLVEPILLTTIQAAQALNISRSRTIELIASGELRSVKIRGSRRISTKALDEFVAKLESDTAA